MNDYIEYVRYKLERAEIKLDEAIRNDYLNDTIYWTGYRDALTSILQVMEN